MERRPGFNAVVFDAVGTLIEPDPTVAAAYGRIGREFGSGLDDATIGRRFRAAFRREEIRDAGTGWRTDEARERDRWERIVTAVLDDITDRPACFEALWDHFARPGSWRVTPLAGRVAGLLARGATVGIASNFDRRLLDVVAGQPQLAGVRFVLASSVIGARKPSPRFFAAVAAACDRPAAEILYVGDDPLKDVAAARACGLQAVEAASFNDEG